MTFPPSLASKRYRICVDEIQRHRLRNIARTPLVEEVSAVLETCMSEATMFMFLKRKTAARNCGLTPISSMTAN